MAAARISFTDKNVAALPFAGVGQTIVRDADLPGFFLKIGTRTKAFMVQGDLWTNDKRQSLTVKVGEAGKIPAREARAKAKVLLGTIADGIDPRPKPAMPPEPVATVAGGSPTLRAAWEAYRDSHMRRKGRSEGTISNYEDHVERLLADWLEKPLSELGHDPSLVKARHDKLSDENGPYIANGCMRSVRAIYNHARKTARSLPPENPVLAIDWNVERRRDTAMGVSDLLPWLEELADLENPVRREFHLFLLLSGSRPDPIKRASVEHLYLRRRILHIPKPKGGSDRAFNIPLSREMIRCLVRAIRAGQAVYPVQAERWLFPADSASGHMVEHKEDRRELSKWGNDLRQTYRTVGQVAGVNDVDMHLLMNHAMPGVNAGYITRNKLLTDHLRNQQQRISTMVIQRARLEAETGNAVRVWLFSPGSKAPFAASGSPRKNTATSRACKINL